MSPFFMNDKETIIFHVFPFHQRAVFINLGLIGGLIISAIREPK